MTGRGRVLLVMGVSGAGKTTVGRLLAAELGWTFVEGDAFHTASSVAKMRAGTPLDDEDRAPWLAALRAEIERITESGGDVVVACSALRQRYRRTLLGGLGHVAIVWLHGEASLLGARLAAREDHFMPAALLDSQLATLDPPDALAEREPLEFGAWTDRGLVIDGIDSPEGAAAAVLGRLDVARSGEVRE